MENDLDVSLLDNYLLVKQWFKEYTRIILINLFFYLVLLLFCLIFSDESVRLLIFILYLINSILIIFISVVFHRRMRSMMNVIS
jgi:hypothetical protein